MTKEEALNRVAALCARSEKCAADIRRKLEKLKLEKTTIDEIIHYLTEQKFIDEERYARAFANDKMRFNKWGKNKIRFSLRQKNINKTRIDEAIANIAPKEYEEIMKNELAKKNKLIKEKEIYKRKQKLLQFAASRGIEEHLAYELIDLIVQKN